MKEIHLGNIEALSGRSKTFRLQAVPKDRSNAVIERLKRAAKANLEEVPQRKRLSRLSDVRPEDEYTRLSGEQGQFPSYQRNRALRQSSQGRNSAPTRITSASEEHSGESIPADPNQLKELEALIALGTSEGDPCKEFGMFCDQTTPQWFAVKVNQPDTNSAKRVEKLIQYAMKRHPKLKLPNGAEVEREIEVLVPKKVIKAWSPRSGQLGTRTVLWMEGGFVMFKAIMDSTLAGYFQPWFLDEKDFWWKRMGATPRSYAMTEFVNGVRVRSHYHIPRPCPERLLSEMREWMETEETWEEEKVMENDFAVINGDTGQIEIQQLSTGADDKWRKVSEKSGGRSLQELTSERLMLQGVLNENASQAESVLHRKQVEELGKVDAGGWNVGVVDFNRRSQYQRSSNRSRPQAQTFNRTKFAEDPPIRRARPSSDRVPSESWSDASRSAERRPFSRGQRQPEQDRPSRSKFGAESPQGYAQSREDWSGQDYPARNSSRQSRPEPVSDRDYSESQSPPASTSGTRSKNSLWDESDPWLYGGDFSQREQAAGSSGSRADGASKLPSTQSSSSQTTSSGWFGPESSFDSPPRKAQQSESNRRQSSSNSRRGSQDDKAFDQDNFSGQLFEDSALPERAQRRVRGNEERRSRPAQTGWFDPDGAQTDFSEESWLSKDQNQPLGSSGSNNWSDDWFAPPAQSDPQSELPAQRRGSPQNPSGSQRGNSPAREKRQTKKASSDNQWFEGPVVASDFGSQGGDWYRAASGLSQQSKASSKQSSGPKSFEIPRTESSQHKAARKSSAPASDEQTGRNPTPYGDDSSWDSWAATGWSASFEPGQDTYRSTSEPSLATNQIAGSNSTAFSDPSTVPRSSDGVPLEPMWEEAKPPQSSKPPQGIETKAQSGDRLSSASDDSPRPGPKPSTASLAAKAKSAQRSARAASEAKSLPSSPGLRSGVASSQTSRAPISGAKRGQPGVSVPQSQDWDTNFGASSKVSEGFTASGAQPLIGRVAVPRGGIDRLSDIDDDLSRNSDDGAKELEVGAQVKVRGGRYKGSQGQIINLRRNVARVKFNEGEGQAEIPLANCVPIIDSDDDFY